MGLQGTHPSSELFYQTPSLLLRGVRGTQHHTMCNPSPLFTWKLFSVDIVQGMHGVSFTLAAADRTARDAYVTKT